MNDLKLIRFLSKNSLKILLIL